MQNRNMGHGGGGHGGGHGGHGGHGGRGGGNRHHHPRRRMGCCVYVLGLALVISVAITLAIVII
ncbi:MAG: hypothetical protein R3Y65_01865 [Bacillota bacterium]